MHWTASPLATVTVAAGSPLQRPRESVTVSLREVTPGCVARNLICSVILCGSTACGISFTDTVEDTLFDQLFSASLPREARCAAWIGVYMG